MDALINSDLRTHIGRRLADGGLSSSGDIGTDREDSPLQSKRSSTFVDQLSRVMFLIIRRIFTCCSYNSLGLLCNNLLTTNIHTVSDKYHSSLTSFTHLSPYVTCCSFRTDYLSAVHFCVPQLCWRFVLKGE